MRKNFWVFFAMMMMILPAMIFTVSCAKKAVEADSEFEEPIEEIAEEPVEEPETGISDEELMAQQRREDELRRKEMEFSSEDVYFEFDSSTLQSSAQRILTDKADYMIAKPEIGVTIEGHCDERGTEAYNMALGERRADSAKSFIVNMGVDDSRVNIISYGEEKPMDTGGDEEAWAKNRRAHFEVE